jgi:hypothetical protein
MVHRHLLRYDAFRLEPAAGWGCRVRKVVALARRVKTLSGLSWSISESRGTLISERATNSGEQC